MSFMPNSAIFLIILDPILSSQKLVMIVKISVHQYIASGLESILLPLLKNCVPRSLHILLDYFSMLSRNIVS